MNPEKPSEPARTTPSVSPMASPVASPAQSEKADYEAASYSTANYASHIPGYSSPKPKAKRSAGSWLTALLVVVLVAAAGGAAYWFLIRSKPKSSSPANNNTSQTQSKEEVISSKTKHFTSTEFSGLELDYPDNWTMPETTGSGRVTIMSPALQVKDSGGQTVKGQIVLTIRNKQQALPEFAAGNAVASLASEKISYTKPSSVQRAATYLSFLRYASSTATQGLDGIYITGDTGYQIDQAIPKADFTPIDPVMNISFLKCVASCSAAGMPLTVSASIWDDPLFMKPLKTMLASLTVT